MHPSEDTSVRQASLKALQKEPPRKFSQRKTQRINKKYVQKTDTNLSVLFSACMQ